MTREVRSPWSREKGAPDPHGMRGYSPGSRSSPSRADAGHLNRHAGKGWTPLGRREQRQHARARRAVPGPD
jgi:hypothetical protein